MTALKGNYELIDHTADVGLRIRGADLPDILKTAAEGMFAIMAGSSRIENRLKREVEVSSPDREALLMEWLSELLFLSSSRSELYCVFEIVECAENRVRAVVCGEPFDRGRHEWHTEIKGVTYHCLYIKEVEEGLEAAVIFDV